MAIRAEILDDRHVTHDSGSGGPLDGGGGVKVGFVVNLGTPFTFGTLSMHNMGKRPLVLDAIRLRPPLAPSFRLVDVLVAQDPDRRLNSVGTKSLFPPPEADLGQLRPFKGAIVRPREENDMRSTAVLMGLQLDKPGVVSFKQVEIDYHVGSKPYTVRVDLGFQACGPKSAYNGSCPDTGFFGSD
ncbi:MAG: hypothetical protein ACRDHK_11750 [Actinomycetota bacterium]